MKTDELTYGYLPFIGKTKNDDGTVVVRGKAAGPDLDHDLQVMNEAWLASALPEWFATGANVREQHGKVAAGIGKVLEQDGTSWNLEALVVDPVSVLKVDAGVLQGYSIGIKGGQVVKSNRAPNGEIVGGRIVEVSLVDRPCNETCKIDIAKSVDADEKQFVLLDNPALSLVVKAIKANQVTVKADEMPLIQQAITAICALIQQEADELPNDFAEAYDIELLLEALYSLRSFWWCEADEGEVPSPNQPTSLEDIMELSQVTDLVKSAEADDASPESKTELAELRKALLGDGDFISKAEHESAVSSAVEQATAPLVERLEKVEATAAPGGPVVARTNTEVATATARETHLEKADKYEALAVEVTDRDQAAGYRDLAKAEREAAAILTK